VPPDEGGVHVTDSAVNHIGLCVHDINSIGVEDHRRLLDRVEALGGTVLADTDIGVAVFIRDPDGQLIELLETKGAGRA
jgi:predicted enzyme related to lactoylglutathione lyase